jgi:uncharacterized protein YkwD
MQKKKPTTKKAAKTPSVRSGRGISSNSVPKPLPVPSLTAAERKRMVEEENSWRAQDDLRTLRLAEEIKADKSRVQRVRSLIQKEIQVLKSTKLINGG